MSGKGEPATEVNGAPRLLLYVADPRQLDLSQNATQQHLSLNQIHTTLNQNLLQQQKHIIEINGKYSGTLLQASDVHYVQSSPYQLKNNGNKKSNNLNEFKSFGGTVESNCNKEPNVLGLSFENDIRTSENRLKSLESEREQISIWPSDVLKCILVPFGWRRIVNADNVIYISPSGTALASVDQIREYLQTSGTCKCGLPCPLKPEALFSFDPKVESRPYQFPPGGDLTKLCNHKRKLLATMLPGANIESVIEKNKKKHVQRVQMTQRGYQQTNDVFKCFPDQEMGASPNESVTNSGQVRVSNCTSYHGHVINKQELSESQVNFSKNAPGSHFLTVHNGFINSPTHGLRQHNELQHATDNPILTPSDQIMGTHNPPLKQDNYYEGNSKPIKKEYFNKLHNDALNNYCPGKQPLTPEVIQNINQQQHLFIQQNHKQIELAMKAFKSQMIGEQNCGNAQEQNNGQHQNHFVIQNGTVINVNQQRTPPWQVKKVESANVPSGSPVQRMLFNSGKRSEDTQTQFQTIEQYRAQDCMKQQGINARIPPLQQHYPQINTQNLNESQKRKVKNAKSPKKARVDNRFSIYGTGTNRLNQEDKKTVECSGSNPSFMDDPSGYLAQQTALLNNTISRQLSNATDAKISQNNHNLIAKNCLGVQPNKQYKQNCVYSHVADSSEINENQGENTQKSNQMMNASPCCQDCMSIKMESQEIFSNKNNFYMKNNGCKLEDEFQMLEHSPIDDNSMITSTYIERNCCQSGFNSENGGPIQAGTISTSNGSPMETLQLPEPSPTPSNSSRNTDTPQSNNSGSINISSSCNFAVPSPACSNPGSYRDGSDPPTPNSSRLINSSPVPQSVVNNQMLNFPSNQNGNKILTEKDGNHSSPNSLRNNMLSNFEKRNNAQYCPPPHLGGGPMQTLSLGQFHNISNSVAYGQSVMRDTITSVLAGRAQTATTSINASNDAQRLNVNQEMITQKSYAIPPNHPDPFINSVNLPTSYPMHIAGTTAQHMINKSPLEMVQSVVSNVVPKEREPRAIETPRSTPNKNMSSTPILQSGQILISSTGQIVIATQGNMNMPPPAPKLSQVQNLQSSNVSTNVTASVTQMIPAVGNVGQVLNQSMLVNALPGQLVIQPQMMTVDGQVMSQNTVLPQIVTGNVISPGQSSHDSFGEVKHGLIQRLSVLSPENKKKAKKRKQSSPNITSVLHIAAPQNGAGGVILQNSPQNQASPQFSPRGFQLSPNNNISPAPVLQALTIVPGKSGAPAHIVMNGQNAGNFGSQQIISTSPTQPINLLQPVNLLNNTVSNFGGFQQFIVPNLSGGMVMTADGALLQDASSIPMQLQLQNVNGQNVLTPVQNIGSNTSPGMVIRTQNPQGKIVQSQSSPSAQFLSPNGTIMVNNSFNGQLSPLIAFETSPRSKTTPETNQIAASTTTRSNATPPQRNMMQNSTLVRHTLTLSEVTQNASTQFSLANVTQTNQSAQAQTRTKTPRSAARPDSTAHSPPDTTTSPEPDTSAMVQCVSSSEPDVSWTNTCESDMTHGSSTMQQIPNYQIRRDDSEIKFNQTTIINMEPTQHPNVYEKKRKYDFACSKTEKIIKTHTKETFLDEMKCKDISCEAGNMRGASFYARQETFTSNETEKDNNSKDEPHAEESDIPARSSCKNFQPGDLVWGPAKGFPAWPGKLVEIKNLNAMVKWFGGDRSRSMVEVKRLQTLDEGLEAHHQARTKCRKSRKLNTQLEKAIQEAMSELDKMADKPNTAVKQSCSRKQNKKQRNQKPNRNLVKIAPNPHVKDVRLRSSQNR